ncbi:hypothetical protein CVT26_012155 [Gymnopilus dilepis]|uniref:Cytochrome P450 n=1 Tax=Gymnopilus dilepis TaxID=231916 RepID=A0A409W5M5_9AGAR|nr:hypothetical protein CVT26_012155 [Gymnopilus dilepis]
MYMDFSNMGYSHVIDAILPQLGRMDIGAIVKAFLVGVLVVLVMKLIKSLTERSPYEYIPGPEPSSAFGYLLDMHKPDNLDFHFNMTERYGHVARLKGGLFGIASVGWAVHLRPFGVEFHTHSRSEYFSRVHGILWVGASYLRPGLALTNIAVSLFGIIHHGDGLASVWGNEHKKQRKLMNPVFTAAYVSKLTPLFYRIANQLRARLTAQVKSGPVEMDILDGLTRTALELISQGGMGHTFNSFDENSKEFSEFHEALKDVLPAASRLFYLLPYLESWRKIRPVWLRRTLAKIAYSLPWPSLRYFMNAVNTMHPVCARVFDEKRDALEKGGMEALASTTSGGRDLTTLLSECARKVRRLNAADTTSSLVQANVEAEEQDRMPDEIVVANISSIVLAGQETTSGAMSRLIDLMTSNPALQDWIREEISEALAKNNGEPLDYYELNALPRLDALCREALRLFAPVTFVWRQTMEDTLLPLQYPIKDLKTGQDVYEVFVQKGTAVYVGLSSTNRSTTIWGPDATEFKPERWIGRQAHESTVEQVKTPETVMSVLLPTFKFEKTKDVIDWRLGITLSPYVRGRENEGPRVPMKVSLL